MSDYYTYVPRLTVGLLKEVITGYCNECPHCKNPDDCCQSGCLGLRILSDIETVVAEKRAEKMREFDRSVNSLPINADLSYMAERITTANKVLKSVYGDESAGRSENVDTQ